MITKEDILKQASAFLEGTDKFVTQVKQTPTNHIEVLIDGESPVQISDCVDLSRKLETYIDSQLENFSLDVSSHGATNPLVDKRQYKKHMGKTFKIKLNDNTVHEGELAEFNQDTLTLTYKVRENKPIGKGKITVEKTDIIPFNQIQESKIKLKF